MTGEHNGMRDGNDAVAAEHDELALSDAAYLLGALDPDEHARFERHLLACDRCQDAIAELGPLPGLLAGVLIGELTDPADPSVLRPPATLLPRLLASVAETRRRRTWRASVVGFAVACVLGLLVGVGVHVWADSHHAQAVAMASVGPNNGDVRATVTLISAGSSTRIRLDCGYRSDASYPAATTTYRMVVVNRRGQQRELGSWDARTGEYIELTRDSPWSRANLSRVEVTDANGTALLQLSL